MVRDKVERILDRAKKEAYDNSVTNTSDKIDTSIDISLPHLRFKDKCANVRSADIEVLANIGTAKDIPLLEPLLKNDYNYIPAFKAITKIYKRSTPRLRIDRVSPMKKKEKALQVQTFTSKSLHILHISDIHYALEKGPTITQIFHEFLQDIKKWRYQHNNEKIHSICLTGDIAFSGQKSQYDSIYEKIDAILEAAGCSKDNIFIIPGNHDVQEYDKISDRGKAALEEVWQNKKNIDSLMLSHVDHYREFHAKFTHYYRFLETSGYHSSLTERYDGSFKTWYSRKLKDFPVRIIGLNSALFCLQKYSEYGKIRMGKTQFLEAYMKGKQLGESNGELCILLTHHPIDWLEEKEKDELIKLIDRYSVIHLHGHIHRLDINEVRSFSGSTYILVGTGSIYGQKGTNDINTYHIMTLDFAKKKVRIWGRRWVPEMGKWTVYADNNRNTFSFPGKHE